MEIITQRKFFSDRDALKLLMEETSKTNDQMDIELVKECLYYLYPEDEEDRKYIEKTLPILHDKLGFEDQTRTIRHNWSRLIGVAILVFMGTVLLASMVAYAFGINVINFFVYGTNEYWMIHVNTPEIIETTDVDFPASLDCYEAWGDAIVKRVKKMDMSPALPKEIPEGYEYVSEKETSVYGFYDEWKYNFRNISGNEITLVLRVMKYGSVDAKSDIQKETGSEKLLHRNGLDIVMGQNFDSVSATWISGNCRISIIGNCTMETLETMINTV